MKTISSTLRCTYGKNGFVKVSKLKILLDTNLKIILLGRQNNYVEHG